MTHLHFAPVLFPCLRDGSLTKAGSSRHSEWRNPTPSRTLSVHCVSPPDRTSVTEWEGVRGPTDGRRGSRTTRTRRHTTVLQTEVLTQTDEVPNQGTPRGPSTPSLLRIAEFLGSDEGPRVSWGPRKDSDRRKREVSVCNENRTTLSVNLNAPVLPHSVLRGHTEDVNPLLLGR